MSALLDNGHKLEVAAYFLNRLEEDLSNLKSESLLSHFASQGFEQVAAPHTILTQTAPQSV
jgi:hypothetical protein